MLIREFIRAGRGKKLWKHIQSVPDCQSTLFIVLPDYDPSYIYFGLRCAPVYAEKHGFRRLTILSVESLVEKLAAELIDMPFSVSLYSDVDMMCLLRYLAMHIDFVGLSTIMNARIVSINNLQGDAIKALDTYRIFSKQHLVWSRMLNKPVDCVTQLELPLYEYKGEDDQLLQFFAAVSE